MTVNFFILLPGLLERRSYHLRTNWNNREEEEEEEEVTPSYIFK